MDDERYYIEDKEKVGLLQDILITMTSKSVGELIKFTGRIEGTEMVVSFDVSEFSGSSDILRENYPLSGKNAIFSDIVKRVQKFSVIAHSEYITIEFRIKDYLIEESLDF